MSNVWKRDCIPTNGMIIPLNLTVEKNVKSFTDEAGKTGETVYLASVGKGAGKFRSGEIIYTCPKTGERVSLDIKIKLMPKKADTAVTISSSKFSIG